MHDFIGWIGSTLLAICAIPLAIQAIRNKHIDINSTFLYSWMVGEIASFIYIYGDIILMFNYGVNIICLIPVVVYSYKPNSKKNKHMN